MRRRDLPAFLAAATLGLVALPGCSREPMKTLVFASAVSGRLVNQGQPLPGMRITRTVADASVTSTDAVTTGPNGEFAFPDMPRKRSWLSFFPGEVVTSVGLTVSWKGADVEVLSYGKRDFDPFSEFGGRAVAFEFDPGEPRYRLDFGDGVLSRSATARLTSAARQALGAVVKKQVDEAEAERLKSLFK